MSHTLSRMKLGEVFRIMDRAGETHDGFFAGRYKVPDCPGWTYYNFLYWVDSPKNPNKTFMRIHQDISWQTSDFFRYKEDIIQSLACVKIRSFGVFHFPLLRQLAGGLSPEKPWLGLSSYQIFIADTSTQEDIDALFKIIKLEEDRSIDNLRRPLLPKRRKEEYTNDSCAKRS